MRINAYLARAGLASRRGADELIKAGRIKVNGSRASLNTEVNESDEVTLDDKPVKTQALRYILLNKPAGTVTTLDDPEGRKTVTDLVGIPERIVPVGRLDYDTTGALLLTNDGELAHRLMHPSFEVDKVYEAVVAGEITNNAIQELETGVRLDDGVAAPAKAKQIDKSKIELIIHEGRKHQVKRMLAAVGMPVKKLHRSRYASLNLAGLQPGEWRELTETEISTLKMVQ